MNINLLTTFIILNIANVIIQTVKSIATINCGKTVAAIVNAVAYGLYTIVTVYMLCDLPLMAKAGIVALCNLVGVFIVKWFEEKGRKERLWKIEATIPAIENEKRLTLALLSADIPHNFFKSSNDDTVFNIYCATKKQSQAVKEILNTFHAKYFVSESKIL